MVRSVTFWGIWSRKAVVLAGLAIAPAAHSANGPLGQTGIGEPVQARFDTATRQTWVTGRVATDLCFSLTLPDEWRRSTQGLKAASSDVELAVSLRSAQELRDLPQPDLASRDAAVLQRDYEELLGRPAQSVSLTSNAGATRWSATWIDASLPMSSHAMTVETLIIPLSSDWVLELSLSGVEAQEDYHALTQRLLARLKVQGRASCQG